jgi:hypothetical protein
MSGKPRPVTLFELKAIRNCLIKHLRSCEYRFKTARKSFEEATSARDYINRAIYQKEHHDAE